MAAPEIHIDVKDDGVGVVEFIHGPYNFLDNSLASTLADACESVASDGARAILLSPVGPHFCAGADFTDGADDEFFVDGAPEGHPYDHVLRMMGQPLPIVAACSGAVIGGGLGMALACDFRVASPESRLAAPFVRLGLHHGCGITVTLPDVVGRQHAKDLLYSGRRIGGEEAYRIGLVDELAAANQLRERARARAAMMAATAPITLRSVRATMQGDLVERVRAAMAHERDVQALERSTADHAEGVAADRARRTPEFRGR